MQKIEPIYTQQINDFEDNRGKIWSAFESCKEFKASNHTKINTNKKGVFRGFHSDHKTTKLVSCLKGSIKSIVIWPDNKKYMTYNLSEANHATLLIPPNFYNGFLSLTESLYIYNLSYIGNYIDADGQKTIRLEDSCVPLGEITEYFKIDDLVRSSRDYSE